MHLREIGLRMADPAVAAVVRNASLSRVQNTSQLVQKIRAEFSAQKGLFEKLEPVSEGVDRVRIYDASGVNVAIKFCGMEFENDRAAGIWICSSAPIEFAWDNGSNVEMYSEFFEKYGKFLSENGLRQEKYALVPIEAYGTFKISADAGAYRVYLAMERFRPENGSMMGAAQVPSLVVAQKEFFSHWEAFKNTAPETCLQFKDSLILGNTDKDKPEGGKWVFALPHDYE